MVEIEDHFLYLSEVPNEMGLLESRMNEIVAKADRIDEMAGRIEAILVHKLMVRVEALENKPITVDCFEHGDSSMGSVAQMEKCIKNLDNN